MAYRGVLVQVDSNRKHGVAEAARACSPNL